MLNKWTKILHSQTPKKWLRKALESQEILLIDHAHCEKKAATTAISLIHRYPDKNLAKKVKVITPDPAHVNVSAGGIAKYSKNKKEAISSFPKFQSELMRVAKKGVVNKKSAARKISRISKKIKNITK